jgi:ferritin
MLIESIRQGINNQIALEQNAAQVYTEISNVFSNLGLSGFSNWANKQAIEERIHVQKFIDHIALHMAKLELLAVSSIEFKGESNSLFEVFEEILKIEQSITASISNLMISSVLENDFSTQNLLAWFIDEQVKSEFEINRIIKRIKIAEDNVSAILSLDREIGNTHI